MRRIITSRRKKPALPSTMKSQPTMKMTMAITSIFQIASVLIMSSNVSLITNVSCWKNVATTIPTAQTVQMNLNVLTSTVPSASCHMLYQLLLVNQMMILSLPLVRKQVIGCSYRCWLHKPLMHIHNLCVFACFASKEKYRHRNKLILLAVFPKFIFFDVR